MDYEKLGDNIRNYREQRGFTQEKLAELSNISEKHLSKIERGKINIKIDTLVNIADALGTSVDKLLLDASSFTKKARKIRRLPCGLRLFIGTMILLPSHSPSVKSVAGNGGSSVGRRRGEIPMECFCKAPSVIASKQKF